MASSYDWVARLENTETPELALREALEQSLADHTLPAFTQRLNQLAPETINNVLESTPLDLVPIILLADDAIEQHPNDVQQTLKLISQHGNPKQVLLAAQESLETISHQTASHIVWKWIRLVDMYSSAFPRLVPRKRSASDMATPIIQHLQQSLDKLGPFVDPTTSKQVVESCIQFGYTLLRWFDAVGADKEAITHCKTSLDQLLSDEHIIKEHDEFLYHLRAASLSFANSNTNKGLTARTEPQTIGAFVLFYLSQRGPVRPKGTRSALKSHLDGLSLCLQQARWRQTAIGGLDDCVLGGLYDEEVLEEDLAMDVVPTVSAAASTDPDPKHRARLFDILTRMIFKVQPTVAFKLVRDLASKECPFRNMRASAIGLLRRLVVRAFSQGMPRRVDDPFRSRLLLEEFNPIFSSLALKEAPDVQEMNRIVEALGFYQVVLGRDEANVTGIRDAESVQAIQDALISPLRRLLERPTDDPGIGFTLRSASISLGRLEESLAELNPSKQVV